jgi:NADH-quinone oxidoreductase chain G
LNYFYVNNIKINNIEKNRNIIDYLENLNIKIPHYCYHQNLSVSGNCRMCLVELKNSPKPLVSCAMSITNKMEIFTESPLVKKARENVLEFLLLNHPLDCPVCDQGGECDLQDQSMVFGISKKRFYTYKRSVSNKNLGPIVKTVMTRCIHCTRCVRFATEIAGVEDLGVFGRGNSSEIGTYVDKIFSSELSGNVIDICPVGALTSKPYSFIDRTWELKNVNSMDFSDGFCTNIQLSIKNDYTITKVLPKLNKQDLTSSWISDKTRFSFDGMFSSERISSLLFSNEKSYLNKSFSWKEIFKEIVYILYFKDHLNKHLLEISKLTIIIGQSLNLETLNLLILLEKKYPFLTVKQLNFNIHNKDIEYNLLTNTANNISKLNSSTLCLMIGINTRLEGSILNIKLRQRHLKGNFKVFTINSLTDLTFPIQNLGSNINIFKNIIEGNHLFCQKLKSATNPLIIYNSTLFSRNDSTVFNFLLNSLNNVIKICTNNWNGNNCLNSSINDVGIYSLGIIKSFTKNDFMNSSGLYFIETNIYSTNILKLLELKLLNYLKTENYTDKYIIEQNSIFTKNLNKAQNKKINLSPYIGLPTTTLFEDSGVYKNTEGTFKKNIKVIPSIKDSKSNWQILRRLFSYFDQNLLQTNKHTKLSFNSINYSNFIKYNCFHFFNVSTLNSSNIYFINNTSNYLITPKNYYKQNFNKKLFKTKTILWIDDFYIGGKDSYSKFSKVMIECSKFVRLNSTNFKYII